jgi:hypothetical protein
MKEEGLDGVPRQSKRPAEDDEMPDHGARALLIALIDTLDDNKKAICNTTSANAPKRSRRRS